MKTKISLFSLVTLVAMISSLLTLPCLNAVAQETASKNTSVSNIVSMSKLDNAVDSLLKEIEQKAQFHVDEIKVSEGKGAMTSGFDVVLSLSNPKGIIVAIQANNERSNIRIGKSWGDAEKFGSFTILGTAGAFKNIPWGGLMALYSYQFNDLWSVDFCSWTGFGLSTDYKVPDSIDRKFYFNYEEAGLSFGKNRVAYSIMLFNSSKFNHFLVYKRTFPLNEKSSLFVETTWDFTQKIPLLVLGYKCSFTK